MLSQKQAVVNTVIGVLNENGIEYSPFQEQPASELLTDAMKVKIRSIICQGFRADKIVLSDSAKVKFQGDSELKSYVSGLVNNHLRKAKDINGNIVYRAKKPGSRTGSNDPMMKEMRKVLKGLTPEMEGYDLVKSEIDKRVAELKPKDEPINVDVLPEHLRHLVG